jgi:hypothetical protein
MRLGIGEINSEESRDREDVDRQSSTTLQAQADEALGVRALSLRFRLA